MKRASTNPLPTPPAPSHIPPLSDYAKLPADTLQTLLSQAEARYNTLKSKNLSLNMTRGKPSNDQTSLSDAILSLPPSSETTTASKIDTKNYGVLEGIPEARELFASLLSLPSKENVFAGGPSSLTLMFDFILRGVVFGWGGNTPWCQLEGGVKSVKWLCPVPGYDRHFGILERLGIEMVNVKMDENGPDMDQVEELVKDDKVKGIWCVPQYSNPSGVVYSDEVVDRLAKMKAAAPDFRVFWDNAYAVHHLDFENTKEVKNFYQTCVDAGNKDRPIIFGSTSKITHAGSGVAAFGCSEENLKDAFSVMSKQMIGPDKMNQLRHVLFLKDKENVIAHMKKHAAILKPKFEVVLEVFEKELKEKNFARWTKPQGGYFITLWTPKGCGKEVVKLAGDIGIALTDAGSVYPYHKDPEDSCLRVAPSFPPVEDLKVAAEGMAICVQLAALRKAISEKK